MYSTQQTLSLGYICENMKSVETDSHHRKIAHINTTFGTIQKNSSGKPLSGITSESPIINAECIIPYRLGQCHISN